MLKIKNLRLIFIFLFLINLIVWFNYFSSFNKYLAIHFVNVGNGDGIFIKTPENFKIVIDGGPMNQFSDYLGINFPFAGRDIDLLILSHPHEDHVMGALDILKNYNVKKILASGVFSDSPAYVKFIEIAKVKNVDIIVGEEGQNLKFGSLEIKVIYPFVSQDNKKISNINNGSLVFRVEYKNFSTLFLGDIEKDVADEILFSGVNIKSEVVKVSHQGSKNGVQNVSKFLEIASPKIAIISVGKNSYGHPSQETLDILNRAGIKTLRTDIDGNILINSDGDNYWLND